MQLVVNSLLTMYRRTGKSGRNRPVVLLLHGWGDAAVSWTGLETALAKDFDVIAPDLPGFGGSQQPQEDWNLHDFAVFIEAFLKKLNVKKLHAVVGHSNGGAMAVRGLAEGLIKPDKLVLLASAGIRTEMQGRKKLLRVVTKTGKVLSAPLPQSVRRRLRRQLYASTGSDMLVVERMQGTFKKIVADDIQADAAQLKLPTLLVYGEDDMAAPVHYGRILHNLIAGSKLEVVDGAGHFVHHDKSETVEGLVAEFLA